MLIVCTMCSTQARRRAGLRVSPGVLLQDQLIQREIRDGLPEALVLGLQRLHALDLIGLEPAVLLPPAIVRHLGHPDGADRIRHRGPLGNQHIDLAQLGDNLFRLVSLPRHGSVLLWLRSHTSGRTTSKGEDQVAASRNESCMGASWSTYRNWSGTRGPVNELVA